MEPNIKYILDSLRKAFNPYSSVAFSESIRTDILDDLDDLLGELKDRNELGDWHVFFVTGEPHTNTPIHIELNLKVGRTNTDLFNVLVQITRSGTFVYALCVDDNGDERLDVYGDGSAKSAPKQPISENPNDAWDRAMRGM